jgi:hypothetical protein
MEMFEFVTDLPFDRSGHDMGSASATKRAFSVEIWELFDGTVLNEGGNVFSDRLFVYELLNFFSWTF